MRISNELLPKVVKFNNNLEDLEKFEWPKCFVCSKWATHANAFWACDEHAYLNFEDAVKIRNANA